MTLPTRVATRAGDLTEELEAARDDLKSTRQRIRACESAIPTYEEHVFEREGRAQTEAKADLRRAQDDLAAALAMVGPQEARIRVLERRLAEERAFGDAAARERAIARRQVVERQVIAVYSETRQALDTFVQALDDLSARQRQLKRDASSCLPLRIALLDEHRATQQARDAVAWLRPLWITPASLMPPQTPPTAPIAEESTDE